TIPARSDRTLWCAIDCATGEIEVRPIGPIFRSRHAYSKHINLCSLPSAQYGLSKSFNGRLAQIWAMQACNLERRAWSSAEEFCLGWMRPCRPRAINALPLPAHGFCAGRGRGEWGCSAQPSELLHLTGF